MHSSPSRIAAATLLLSSLLPTALALAPQLFADVPPNTWYAAYVEQAAAAGIVGGYKDVRGNPTGLFGPADNVTLGQALKIAVMSAGYSVGPESGMYGWATPYIDIAMQQRFTMEFTGDTNRPATRAEVARIVVDAFKVDTETPIGNRYDDVGFSTTHGFAIEALSRDGVVSGDTDAAGRPLARFRPADNINRAEVTKIAIQAKAIYGSKGGSASSVSSKKPQASSASSVISAGAIVTLTSDGFSPSTVTVKKGTTVTFKNESAAAMWPASNPHPVHTAYPAFDALRPIQPGESFTFTFDQPGNWGYHDHIGPNAGMVQVTE